MQPKFRIQTELPYEKQLMHKEIVMKKNRVFFHPDRAPDRNCDHRDPRRNASSGIEPGTGKGAAGQLHVKYETTGAGFLRIPE